MINIFFQRRGMNTPVACRWSDSEEQKAGVQEKTKRSTPTNWHIAPMSIWCWAGVEDAGPTSNRHRDHPRGTLADWHAGLSRGSCVCPAGRCRARPPGGGQGWIMNKAGGKRSTKLYSRIYRLVAAFWRRLMRWPVRRDGSSAFLPDRVGVAAPPSISSTMSTRSKRFPCCRGITHVKIPVAVEIGLLS